MSILEGLEEWWQQTKDVFTAVATDIDDIWYKEEDTSNLCGYHEGSLNQFYTLIKCPSPITGQFVQIQLGVMAVLNLYEVEVWGW